MTGRFSDDIEVDLLMFKYGQLNAVNTDSQTVISFESWLFLSFFLSVPVLFIQFHHKKNPIYFASWPCYCPLTFIFTI